MLDSDYGSHPPLGPATPFLKRGSSRRDDKVKIRFEEELPGGTRMYESTSKRDYDVIHGFASGKRCVFTVSEEGKIESAEPIEDEIEM